MRAQPKKEKKSETVGLILQASRLLPHSSKLTFILTATTRQVTSGTQEVKAEKKNVCSGDRCTQTATLSLHDRSTHKLFLILGLQMSPVRADRDPNPADDLEAFWPEEEIFVSHAQMFSRIFTVAADFLIGTERLTYRSDD